MAQLGVRRKISSSSSQKKSLNVAADVVENIKKPAGNLRDKAKRLEEIKRKNKHTLGKELILGGKKTAGRMSRKKGKQKPRHWVREGGRERERSSNWNMHCLCGKGFVLDGFVQN